ncbi:unnamed protein product [Mytilus coruscus]|uniref:Integrase zinc-binding domain-containing protein n=1 Tax=Mytilus coruscus TaxID=42192 RepID=A0A6J8BUD2_MYTCO|nr:unnamed protein product [Mytilus coruscus]
MSDVSAPLRVLLEEKNEWCWKKEQDTSFNKLKDMATNAPILSYYDPKQPLTLNVDASSKGLDAVLLQNDKPIAYASRLFLDSKSSTIMFTLNAHFPISPEKYELFKKQTKSDEILQQMKKTNEEGWPLKKEELPEDLKMYWQFRNKITCIDNLLYKGLKLIIPTSLRKEMLQLIHETHMVKCKTRARDFMYWPGMMSDIQDIVEKCEICAVNNKKTNNKEPMVTSNASR